MNRFVPRTGATSERLALAERVAELRGLGWTQQRIGDELGLGRSWVSELLNDPDGEKARARKDTYRGECVKCGAPTSGCHGPDSAPDTCWRCHEQAQIWTPERIIGAIQEWASIYEAPPRATDWLKSVEGSQGRGIVNARRYPSVATVMARFGSWAEGIEAAGYERPLIGKHKRPQGTGGSQMARTYIVLEQNGAGPKEIARVEAYSPELAIEKTAQQPGKYIAVLATHWVEAEVKPVERLVAVRS